MLSGKLKVDDVIPSEHELSALFNISRHTVRQAIGEMVRDQWLYRIQGKGTFVKNSQRRTEDTTKTIGVITTYISDYIFPLIIRGAESTLSAKGYRLLLASTDNDKHKEKQSLEMMMDYPLSGLLIEPTKSALENRNHHYFLQLEYKKIPYVMINERYPELNCPCLQVDDEMGSYLATEHLIQLGHTKIAGFFKTDDRQGIRRLEGFTRAHQEYNLNQIDILVHKYTTEVRSFKPLEAAFSYLHQKDRPTAFVVYNDQLAIQILEVARQSGVIVPDDLSIVSFDDSNLAVATEVKLTSVSHPKNNLGIAAANRLIDLIENPMTVLIENNTNFNRSIEKPSLIVRQSTRRIN